MASPASPQKIPTVSRGRGERVRLLLHRILQRVTALKCGLAHALSLRNRPPEFAYTIGGHEFIVRRDTSDREILREVWIGQPYPVPAAGSVVVDIGANIGAYAVFAARTAAHVYAFEPVPPTFRQLLRNTRCCSNVTTLPLAVAGTPGERTIAFFADHPGQASMVRGSGDREETVQAITLEQLFALCNLTTIDLMKMDIEGAEYDVLSRAPQALLRRIASLALEFHGFVPGWHWSALVRLLTDAGFSLPVCTASRWTGSGYLHARR